MKNQVIKVKSVKHGKKESKVIKLPKKNKDRVMWVWDGDIPNPKNIKRVVFMKKNGCYLAWNGCQTLEDTKNELNVTSWQNAEKI